MITYECCTNVSIEKIYEAFMIGFSDSIIKNQIKVEDFQSKFFGAQGNKLENSFIAMDTDKPIGLILSGVKKFDGKDTVKCGTLCVEPKYKNLGVSEELFHLHKISETKSKGNQLFLEVISQSDRAIRFYTKIENKKKHDLFYYTNRDIAFLKEMEINNDVSEISFDEFSSIESRLQNIHINWQNDFDYMQKLKGAVKYYGIYKKSEIKGALAIGTAGKIYSIWVDRGHRKRYMGTDLIIKAVKDLNLKSLYLNFPDNIEVEEFVGKLKFKKDNLSQYEMYLVL